MNDKPVVSISADDVVVLRGAADLNFYQQKTKRDMLKFFPFVAVAFLGYWYFVTDRENDRLIRSLVVIGLISLFGFAPSRKDTAINEGLTWAISEMGVYFSTRPFVPFSDIRSVGGNSSMIDIRRKRGYYTIRLLGIQNAQEFIETVRERMPA